MATAFGQNYETDFVVGGQENIDDERRVNIFILSDGYTASQEADFLESAQDLTDELFSSNSSPFDIYGDYFRWVLKIGFF